MTNESHVPTPINDHGNGEQAHYILQRIGPITRHPDGIEVDVTALRAVSLPHTPGWLTGQTPQEQGIETGMPNLPQDLHLPELEEVTRRVRVRAVGPTAVRITLAPADHQLWTQDELWPGIMIAPVIEDTHVELRDSGDGLEVDLGECVLRIDTHPFALSLWRAGRRLLRTGERLRQVAGFPMAPPVLVTESTISLNLEMGTDEGIFGFGEQFSRLEKNGQQMTLTVNDALGTGTGLAYKPVPLWHSTAGYSAFINTGADVHVDVGHERPSVLGLTLDDAALDLVLLAAPTPRERLADYTQLTGRAVRPPLWAFGYWMGRCRYHSAEEMLDIAEQMRAEEVPCDVLHLDPDWLIVDRLNTDFIWNTDRFGDRRQFIDDLRRHGLRLSLWQLPYLDPASPLFDEAKAGGHLLTMPDGELAHIQGTPTPDGRFRALYDYSNPDTRAWLLDKERAFLDDGLAVIKTDFGEGCPPGAVSADGTPGNYIHNLYPLKYNGAIFDTIGELVERPPLVWGRSGWAGSQRYPGQWGGDAESTVVGMQATLRGGLSYAVSAPGLWSHDIGGFYGPELTPGLYIRWTQLGAFSPLMRAHGLRPREPWEFGAEALDICREWIRTRYSLLPYIWQVAGEVERTGMPFLRPLCLDFPNDRFALTIDDEYLFGDSLLVAPVMDDMMDDTTRKVYLPEGVWYDFFTDERFEGPVTIERKVGIDQVPVYVRDGAVVPRVAVDATIRSTEDLLGTPWTVHVWGAGDVAGLDGFDGAPKIQAVVQHA